jgi:hypothetical protein
MQDQPPLAHEWAALYQVAADFKRIAAWEWMYDSDLFGVQNPADGEIGYCCVMGNLGEHYALGVYLGTEGLASDLYIQSGAVDPPDMSVLYIQKCLMASYEDRELLEQPDRALIKELGLKFRGRNAWPLFRSYRPGYHPWFLTSAEARFLTIALEQAINVALRYKDDLQLLTPPRKGQYFVRVPEQRADGLHWSDRWLMPAPSKPAEVLPQRPDELQIQRIKQTITARQGAWEADYFRAPAPIQEHKGERPYYPYMSLWVDRASGMILHTDMTPAADYRAAFQQQFLDLIEQIRFLPRELYVKQPEAQALLASITEPLKIKLKTTRVLPMLDEAHSSLFSYFQQF